MVSDYATCGKQYNDATKDITFHKTVQTEGRRMLKQDLVPTIFEKTERQQSKIEESHSFETTAKDQSLVHGLDDLGNEEPQIVEVDTTIIDDTMPFIDPIRNLSPQNLASTSITTEHHTQIAMDSFLTHLQKNIPDTLPESIETPVVTSVVMAEINSNGSKQKIQSSKKRKMYFSKPMKRDQSSEIVRPDVTLLQEHPYLVEPEDLDQLTYNDSTQISRNWTVLNNYITKVRLNMKSLQQRNRRLEKRATDLRSVVAFLKNRIVAKDSGADKTYAPIDVPTVTGTPLEKDDLQRATNPLVDHDYIPSANRSLINTL